MNDYQQILERARKWRSDKCLRYNLSAARRHDAEAYHILTQLLAALDAAQPVAWALTMPDGVRLIYTTEEASRRAEAKWPEAYAGCQHVPLYLAPQAPPADAALADTQRAIIEAAERRGYERRMAEEKDAAVPAGYALVHVDRMLAACLPGGSSCDPQRVADAIREYVAAQAPPAAVPLPAPLPPTPDTVNLTDAQREVEDAFRRGWNSCRATVMQTTANKENNDG